MVLPPSTDGVWAAAQAEGGGRIHGRWAESDAFFFTGLLGYPEVGTSVSWVFLVAVFIASLWVGEKSCWHAVLGVSLALLCDLTFPYTGSWFSPVCRMIALQLCH